MALEQTWNSPMQEFEALLDINWNLVFQMTKRMLRDGNLHATTFSFWKSLF